MTRVTAALLLQLVLVAAIAVHSGFCLHCYECDSATDERCAYNPMEFKECQKSTVQSALETLGILGSSQDSGVTKDQSACLKYVGINVSTKREWVVRQCATIVNNCETSALAILYRPLGYEKKSCDVCYNDKCNSSSILSVELFLLVPLILCGIFFF